MTQPANSNPNLGRGRFVERPAPALRPSRSQRRRGWIAWMCGIYLAWAAFVACILAADWYGPNPTAQASDLLWIIPKALLFAVCLTVPISLIWLDVYWGSYTAQVRHAKARRRLARCCLHCRYPMPPSPHLTARMCTECGIESPNFFTFRRARLIGDSNRFFGTVPPTDRPTSAYTKLLTLREHSECFVHGRAFGLSWPMATIIFALIPAFFLATQCCATARPSPFYPFNPISIGFSVAIFLTLTLCIRSYARTTFALNRFYSPPPPPPTPPQPEPPTTQPPPSQEEGGQV